MSVITPTPTLHDQLSSIANLAANAVTGPLEEQLGRTYLHSLSALAFSHQWLEVVGSAPVDIGRVLARALILYTDQLRSGEVLPAAELAAINSRTMAINPGVFRIGLDWSEALKSRDQGEPAPQYGTDEDDDEGLEADQEAF